MTTKKELKDEFMRLFNQDKKIVSLMCLMFILGCFALIGLVWGFWAAAIYIIWNFICDTFFLTWWISWYQSFALSAIVYVIKRILF